MTNPRLSVDSMCTYPWPFDQELALWSSVGLRHAGLMIAKLGPDPEASMARVSAAGIHASTLITEQFNLAAPETWDKTRAAHRLAIDLMAKHGGHSIYFTPGRTTGALWGEDLERLAEAWRRPLPTARRTA